MRLASKHLFYWVVPSSCSEINLLLFVRFFGFGVLVWPLFGPRNMGQKSTQTFLCSAFREPFGDVRAENRGRPHQRWVFLRPWRWGETSGCGFFAYSCKLPAYSGAFLLTVDKFSFLLTVGAFLLTVLAFLLTVWSFFAYSGKVRLIRALRDCKQRSLTVSKKAPTVSKNLPLKLFDHQASGRKGRECPQEIRTKKLLFMLFFLP